MRRKPFETPANAENSYATQLRKIATHVSNIIASFPVGDVSHLPAMQRALASYADAITPWAKSVALRMQEEVWMSQHKNWKATLPRKNTVAAYKENYNGKNSRNTRDKARISKLARIGDENTSGRGTN